EQYGVHPRSAVVVLDGVAHRVNAATVVRLEEAGLHAERLGEVAVDSRPAREIGERRFDLGLVDFVRIELDVALREHFGVPRSVDRGDVRALPLELLCNPRRPGEEIERGFRARAQLTEYGHQPALGTDVLNQ